ncbi:MAG: ABC transporter ATP-binding protein/permease [Lachnospiraceae bacterium]|nr:ABC transporter ATP-binding protein/permease [Lachnospiraceae bacterium]
MPPKSPAMNFIFRQVYAFLPRLSLIVLLNSAVVFTGIYLAVITKNLIDAATSLVIDVNAVSDTAAGINQIIGNIPQVLKAEPEILRNILLYLLIIAINIVISMTSSFLAVYLNERFEFHMRKKMFNNILKSKWKEITAYHSEDLMVRLTADVRSVSSGLIDTFTTIIVLIVSLLAAFGTLFYYDRIIALFAFALGPIAVCFGIYFGKKIKAYQTKVQESEAKYRAFMQENISNITVVKSFTAEDLMSERLQKLYLERMKLIVKKNRLTIGMGSIVGLTFSLGYIGALAWGILKISMGIMSFGTLSIFLNLVNRVQSPILGLAQTIPNLSNVVASAERIIEIDKRTIETNEKLAIKTWRMGIIFSNVNYSYNDKIIFKNLNLEIPPGSLVALTGASGIGKTTLIRLMMNFLDVGSGSITYRYQDDRGKNVEISATPSIRDYISYVPQGNTLFSGTIKENLLIANSELTSDDINYILESVALLDFVNRLPDGIETVIGERGHGLSEGQAERIAIARALAKRAPIIIFDEATAALDERNEQEVIAGIRRIKHKPTCVFITHRRATLVLMDEEINLEKL